MNKKTFKWWLMPLLLLAPYAQAFAQARAVQPVRVSIESERQAIDGDNAAFHRLFRAELNKRKDIALKSRDFDFAIYLAATRLVEKGATIGVAGAFLVITRDGGRDDMRFDIATAPTFEDLARHLAEKLERDFFKKGR